MREGFFQIPSVYPLIPPPLRGPGRRFNPTGHAADPESGSDRRFWPGGFWLRGLRPGLQCAMLWGCGSAGC